MSADELVGCLAAGYLVIAALVAFFTLVDFKGDKSGRDWARRVFASVFWPIALLVLVCWAASKLPGLVVDAELLPERGRREVHTDQENQWVEKSGRLRWLRRKR